MEIHLYIYARKKHPKHNKLAVTDIHERPVGVFSDFAQVLTLALTIILPI